MKLKSVLLSLGLLVCFAAPINALPQNVIYITDSPYSAVCDGSTDDTVPLANAVNALNSGGGQIIIPRSCRITSTLYVTGPVCFVGLNASTSALVATTDIEMLHFTSSVSYGCVEKLSVYGYQNTSAANNVIRIENNALVNFRDCRVWGGYSAMYDSGVDGVRDNCFFAGWNPAGGGITSQGANWWVRDKIDTAVIAQSYGFLQGTPFPGASSSENHFVQTDFSGSFTNSIVVNDATGNSAIMVFEGGVFSRPIQISNARWVAIGGLAEIGANIYIGNAQVTVADSIGFGAISVSGGSRHCSNNISITC